MTYYTFFASIFMLYLPGGRKGVATMTTLGARVLALRQRTGLSQEKLAQEMHISRNTLWYIESGRTQNPRMNQLVALCRALHVGADYLLGLVDEEQAYDRPGCALRPHGHHAR